MDEGLAGLAAALRRWVGRADPAPLARARPPDPTLARLLRLLLAAALPAPRRRRRGGPDA